MPCGEVVVDPDRLGLRQRAHAVHEDTAAAQQRDRGVDQLDLELRETFDVGFGDPPPRVGTAPESAEPGAWSGDEDAVERSRSQRWTAGVGDDDGRQTVL